MKYLFFVFLFNSFCYLAFEQGITNIQLKTKIDSINGLVKNIEDSSRLMQEGIMEGEISKNNSDTILGAFSMYFLRDKKNHLKRIRYEEWNDSSYLNNYYYYNNDRLIAVIIKEDLEEDKKEIYYFIDQNFHINKNGIYNIRNNSELLNKGIKYLDYYQNNLNL